MTPDLSSTAIKITDRDFAFPEDFPETAKDLVDRLLALDPNERIGRSQRVVIHVESSKVVWVD